MAYYRTTAEWNSFWDFVRSDLSNYTNECGFMYKHGTGKVDIIIATEDDSVLDIISSKYKLESIEDHPAAALEGGYGFVNAEFFDTQKMF